MAVIGSFSTKAGPLEVDKLDEYLTLWGYEYRVKVGGESFVLSFDKKKANTKVVNATEDAYKSLIKSRRLEARKRTLTVDSSIEGKVNQYIDTLTPDPIDQVV